MTAAITDHLRQPMKRLIFLLIFFFCFWAPAHSATQELGIERAFFYDPESSFDIETVTGAVFTPYRNDLSLGFKKGAIWIRLVIPSSLIVESEPAQAARDNQARNNTALDQLVVRVGPHSLDKIELYERDAGQWIHRLAGALHADQAPICLDDFHCFHVHVNPSAQATIYLRIETDLFMFVQADVMHPDALLHAVTKRIREMSISLTMAVGLFILGFLFFLKNRSVLLQVYCLFQFSIVLFLCARSGLHGVFLPGMSAEKLQILNHIFYLMRVFLTVLIGWVVVQPYQPVRSYQLLISSLLSLCLINVVLVIAGHISLALQLNFFVFMLNLYVQLYGVYRLKRMAKQTRTILMSGYAFFILMMGVGFLIAFNISTPFQYSPAFRQISDLRLNGISVGIVFFWFIVLEQSSREKSKAAEMITLRLEAAQAKSNEEKLNDRHTLIDILTHELKNPLGTIRFALASLKRTVVGDEDSSRRFKHIDLCVDRMNALIEHVARSSKIDRFENFDQREKIGAVDLISELIDEYPETDRFEIAIKDDASFDTNREMLTVICENLISNAYKYADHSEKIKITVASCQTFASPPDAEKNLNETCLEIRNAVGIYAAPEEGRLFERYYRHPNAVDLSGLGIGLSLVQAAAQKIGTKVHYLHADGWVIFTVKVPN